MKRIIFLMAALLLGLSVSANATLINRGTDSLGNRLIYDDDLDITWYDYTKSSDTWQNQMNWASGLDVDLGGTHYTDWRLPSAFEQNGSGPYQGWPTNSEMGHLFYNELGGWFGYAISTQHNANYGLFVDLLSTYYWAGTAATGYASPGAWNFTFGSGYQSVFGVDSTLSALAVRDGDVAAAPVPEPGTWMLLGSGLAGLVVFRRKFARS